MSLGGNLLVLANSSGTYQTFQMQGASWAAVPTADLVIPTDIVSFAVDGHTLVIASVPAPFSNTQVLLFQWTGSSWLGPVANISKPTAAPISVVGQVAVDGNYVAVSWALSVQPSPLLVIYESQGGLWSEVFRTALYSGPESLAVSSSGRAASECVAKCDGVTIFEASPNGTWSATQTIKYLVDITGGSLSRAALTANSVAVAETAIPSIGSEFFPGGRIFGCNATSTTSTASTTSTTTTTSTSSPHLPAPYRSYRNCPWVCQRYGRRRHRGFRSLRKMCKHRCRQ
ncbi:unnamed protein product [Symbiodinium natans]|uniref:Uncharacterized protein n=1 Tax=Symbiodinium natans TaxID=878477 RepID=A0A812RAY5_9DINO|nr:unnamed protein product [Symbiodinium natans]